MSDYLSKTGFCCLDAETAITQGFIKTDRKNFYIVKAEWIKLEGMKETHIPINCCPFCGSTEAIKGKELSCPQPNQSSQSQKKDEEENAASVFLPKKPIVAGSKKQSSQKR